MKFEYTGSFFRIVVEFFRLRPEFGRYRVMARREGERHQRKLLRKVIHKVSQPEV